MLKSSEDLIQEAQKHIECVDVQTAKKIYDETPGAIILDVRETESASQSKLNHSINISRGMVEMKMPEEYPNPSTLILTHCAGGGRASLTAHSLKLMGYDHVYAITAPYEEIKKVFG